VPRQQLAALLWSERPDEDARRNLRQELHRLNALPVGEWIVVAGETLSLRAGAEVDVHQLRQAIAATDVTRVAELVRGPLLQGVDLKGAAGFMEWVLAQREAIEQARRAAMRAWARQRENDGDAAAALAALRGLLRDDVLDEPLVRDVMRLADLTGDRGSALALYERLSARLRKHLGAEPQPETTQLARRIQSAPVNAAADDQAPPDLNAPLIGRDEAWTALAAVRSGIALIEGEAGVGKSRLALEHVRAPCLVLKGREVSRDTPFYPVAEALWQAYRDDGRWFEQLDPAWRREVVRLLPALAGDEGEERASELDFTQARGRFLEGLAQALLTAAAGGAVLADDLQWFDSGSAELLAHLARRAHRVRLFATARSDELAANVTVSAALATLARDGLLMRVALAPLSEANVLLLVRALSGSSGASVFSHRLHAATAGNPLFILESLRELFSAGVLWRENGTWATRYDALTEDYRELPLSASVREAVLRRIDRLGAPVRRLLEAASLAGDGFEPEALAECAALDEWEVVDATESAAQARLIVGATPGFRFSHDLIRRALDDALSPQRRRLLHRKLAERLIAARAAPAAIAAHLEGGGRAAPAVRWRVTAAEEAARVYSLRPALAQYDAALADGAAGGEAFRIQSARLELLRNLGDEDGRQATLDAMAQLAAAADDAAMLAETAVKRSVDHFEHDRYQAALETTQAARAALQGRIDPLAEASLLLEMGATLRALGQLDEAEAHLSVALERYRGVSLMKYANTAYWLCQCAIARGDLDRAETLCDISLQATEQAGYRRGHSLSLWTSAEVAFARGDDATGLERVERAYREAHEIGSVPLQRGFLGVLVERTEKLGRAAAAGQWRSLLSALDASG
jgi:DNA-binding SARP family transcriptional activator